MTTVLVDTSAAVALVLGDHEHHVSMQTQVQGLTLGLAGHAAFETYSVLTRMPPPNRREPAVIAEVLRVGFPATVFLSADGQARLHDLLSERGLAGGRVYDALVGAAAAEANLPLLTRDRRAVDTYRMLGVEIRLSE